MNWAYGLVLVAVGLAGACGSSGPMATTCPQGSESCPCYGNQTCNTGLTCLSNLCVNPLTGNGGHSGAGGAVGSAGSMGGAGTTGAGGAVGSAGTSGGAGTTGAAGSGAPVNLIKNGDFGLGKEYWDLTYQAGEVATDNQGSGGQYCIGNPSTSYYLSFSLGYPPTPSDSFAIVAGATYTLTYSASVNSPASVMVKIGQVESPYAELASVTDSPTSSNLTTFTHQITANLGDLTAGLVFNGTLYYDAQICFDNVKLVKN